MKGIFSTNSDTRMYTKTQNCDGVVLEIYFDHKFQRPQEDLNW